MEPTSAIYDRIGHGYAEYRRPDPRIAAHLLSALGDCASVLNVGAGSGSYEPDDRRLLAVEPSITMIRQRPAGAAPVLQGGAEALPIRDGACDAALAILTVHHWHDWRAGVREMRRVARRRVVILTSDLSAVRFWLTDDYFPEILPIDRATMPPIGELCAELGRAVVHTVPVPHDCTDGFLGAYWRRPHTYLDRSARAAISAFSKIEHVEPGLQRLAADLESGAWQRRNAAVLDRDNLDLGYRIVVSDS